MENLVFDNIGLTHLTASIIALISGSLVLALKKGTGFHKKTGYVYAVSMLLVNSTAFMIYRLFGSFGIFHFAALVSLVTLLGGMIPALRKKSKNWIIAHFSFMYWSVLGLYAAFAAEILTRIPETPFLAVTGIATGIIMIAGGLYFHFRKEKWEAQFGVTEL